MKHQAIREDLLTDVVGRLPDNGLRSMRASALRKFLQTGLPATSHEDWRYTSLQPAIAIGNAWLDRFAATGADPSDRTESLTIQACEAQIDANWLKILNGHMVGDIGPDDHEPGIRISVLSSAESNDAHSTALDTGDALSSFNAALLVDAIRIRVEDGANVGKPLGLLFASEAPGQVGLSTSRVLLDIGRDASIDIIESHVSTSGTQSFSNVVIELRLAEGARVNYLRLQDCGDSAIMTGSLKSHIGARASMKYSSVDVGGALIRNDVNVRIESPGAEFFAGGLYLADGSQHIDNHLRVDHMVGPARSDAQFRGILCGRARCVFNSKAIVHKGADGTDAVQANHNLLLSDDAEINTKPELEIYADDVKCAHGATVGQLDKSALFYLRSRGIDEDAATGMLTRAFAASIVGKLAVPAAAAYVSSLVNRRLDALIAI